MVNILQQISKTRFQATIMSFEIVCLLFLLCKITFFMRHGTPCGAYFSATGTTKEAATQLAKAANADLYEIVPEKPYTSADLDWNDDNSRSSVEMKNPKSRPAIKGKVENLGQYDTVYVGFPIWWYTAPTIINTFVESNDLKGKTVITFTTSGGSTVTKATKDLKAAYPGINWKEGPLLNGRTLQEAKALVGKVK